MSEHKLQGVGELTEVTQAIFTADITVESAVETLRDLVNRSVVTYGFLVDRDGKLIGVFAFRELLFAEKHQTLGEISLSSPFSLRADMSIEEAMHETLSRHYPVYPVCDMNGCLLGIVRGHKLFEAQTFEISAQAGMMQGVDREERLYTPWLHSLRFRHPWLQLNLLTAFVAAAVVGAFQDTLDRIIVLAAFLPVLAGQSGNTGCQALAVTLRGLTLGEMKDKPITTLLHKEAALGLANGFLIGLIAAVGMWWYAQGQVPEQASLLALIVWIAMAAACVISGICGALIPLALRRMGADPATASSIFLTTLTDVASMGVFLGLATLLIP
jgi:magnesium transporter